jgi:hypothetical protein
MLADILSLGMGLKILHDPGFFPTDEPRWFHEVDAELARLLEDQTGIVIGGEFTWLPLGFHPRVDGKPGFELSVAHGGPVLKGRVGRVADIRGIPTLAPGEIWYQPQYYNPISQTWDPASEDIKDAYRAIVRRMKRHLIKRALNRSFWISPGAWRLWQEGQVRFLPWAAIQDGRGDLPFPFPPEPLDE